MTCDVTGCEAPEVCALGIALYPPEAVMRHYNFRGPLSTLVVGLKVCEAHAIEMTAAKAEALLAPGQIEPLVKAVEAGGTAVDRKNGIKVVRVAFDSPEYQFLQRQTAARAKPDLEAPDPPGFKGDAP